MPKVVALMPAWNAERFILPVLESLTAQTYPNLKILISDDGSTDRTAEICKDFARRHANVEVLVQARNQGWMGNTNALLNHAEGDYFFFAFHDDRPKPGYVERLVEAMEANPRAVLTFSDMIRRTGTMEPTPDDTKIYTDLEGVTDRAERGIRVARRQGRPPSYVVTLANRGLFRASAARRVGGLRCHLAGEFAGDWPWLLHLSLIGEFVRVPEALIEKYYPPTSLSANWRNSRWQFFGALVGCMREVRRAKLSLQEEFRIHYALIFFALQRQWRGLFE